MKKTILLTACFFGMTAVILGAFGAHGLEKIVDGDAVNTFKTGVRYQMYHAFFLFVVGLLPDTILKRRKAIFVCAVIGVVLFSLSIYVLSLNALTTFDFRIFGVVTPIGGSLLIAAWVMLGYRIWKSKS